MRRVDVDRMRRRLWLDTPGNFAHALTAPSRERHPRPRYALTYLPPGYELTARNLNEHGVPLGDSSLP